MDVSRRNELSGTVHGTSLQAHTISGDVHVHSSADQERLIAVYEELSHVRQQLVESMRAERDITQVVWVLQMVLMRLQDMVMRLAWERDRHVDQAEQQRLELERARDSQSRTERQLVRAESERTNALRLVQVARAKVLVLEAGLRRSGPMEAFPTVELANLDIGLDHIDEYLDEQGERLENLSAELGEPLAVASRRVDFDAMTALSAAVFDDRERLVDANDDFCELLGVPIEQLCGLALTQLTRPDEAGRVLSLGGQRRTLVRSRGDVARCELTAARMIHDDGRSLWFVTFEQVADHLVRDALTGLLNRASLVKVLDDLLDSPNRAQIAVLSCDLDNFKRVNDSLGHDAGDEVLVAFARRLEDGLPQGCTTARLSGDEYMIVCANIGKAGGVDALATKVVSLLRAAVPVHGQLVRISVSIGAAVPSGSKTTGNDLLRFADAAMFEAKRGGAGRVSLASAALIASVDRQVQLEGQLRDALVHDGLMLHFQPVVTADGSVLTAEALVRWRHPDRGLLRPDVFLPVAEQGDMMRELDIWVLRAALAEATTWPASVSVGVNLSGLMPGDPEFVDMVAQLVAESGIQWDRVVLELVETALVDLPSRVRQSMDELVGRGARFAVDGFGTGYSSLARLRDLPAQIIKVDRSFVSGVDKNSTDFAVARAVVDMARAMDCICVADGVETTPQFTLLRDIGVGAYQGWLFAKPMPPVELRSVLVNGPLPMPNVS